MKIAIVFCVIAGVSVLTTNPVGAADAASFTGTQSCAGCHNAAYRAWSGTHHDLAMQEATKATVLGDFGDAEFTAYGVTSRFFNKKGDFYVNTEGPDGVLQDYKIDYTFGVYPLQQYLVAFPGGRYQVLGHEYFHFHPKVAADLIVLLSSGAGAAERSTLRPRERNGIRYWEIVENAIP